ncbi:MAG: glycine cleavage system aminomethyltransferase GcvT [Deltaproteobacteria bacterium]|nr:glycine cleavage system aminomethyltransferase GcvT [Deltaproteobacteria bacterium]
MTDILRTPLHDRHTALGAKMVEFGGWDMPIMYPAGIVDEHLRTRKAAGLFDVSHMGRFMVRGPGRTAFLQHVLTNNAEALDGSENGAQYTFIPNETGGALDDAYLYRFEDDAFLLVVNASNRDKDWEYLQSAASAFDGVDLEDRTFDIAMLALQGPLSREILAPVVDGGALPEPMRNAVGSATIQGHAVQAARTGYTGEPVCFELFLPSGAAPAVWDLLLERGASPVGLGARDTLRLEAGLPLYGHELGTDPEGREIPIMACPLARFAVSFSPRKGDFVGREALLRQFKARGRILARDYSRIADLPRIVRPLAVTGRGVAREGARVFREGAHVGWVTSGTMVPYWKVKGDGLESAQLDEHALRGLGLAYIDADILNDDQVSVEVRGRSIEARVVPYHLRNDAPPYARPIVAGAEPLESPPAATTARKLLEDAIENTIWRQRDCINLIPSEMTASPMVRLLSIMDPSFRYAEHRRVRAFYDTEVFYYQGTEFIARVERLLEQELTAYLGCSEVETRLISGQMANTAVFSAMMQYLNRDDPKREPRRIAPVMNHHIAKGGHLSSQPMGALRDFVARNPKTERPAVVPFPVLPGNPYRVDVRAALERIEEMRPRLIIFGKSMVLCREPVEAIRRFLDESDIDAVVMYDMAHVLGLVGPHFQEPFLEGADLVTGSTHKTFFGTQRGIAATRLQEEEERYALWESVVTRTFPGSVSNHHLGTLLGLLMATCEMNRFKDEYQPRVIANARAFARALNDCGLDVAGDPDEGFTETHQVVVHVGYGKGPEAASALEGNNIICNYQATPEEEGFTASGALRMGVAEMTRFGMSEPDFQELAELIRDVLAKDKDVRDRVRGLRRRHTELKYCFRGDEFDPLMEKLHDLVRSE